MEKLPSGFSSGVQRCARCRWRGKCQHSGKRSAADRAVLSGTGTVLVVSPLLQSYLAVSMACCISTQQGLSETCRVMGTLAASGGLSGLGGFCSAVRAAKSGNGSAGPFCTAVGPAAYRRRTGDRAGSERYGRSISCRNAAAQSSLGFAALAVIGAEFLPLYLQLLLHLLFLAGCRLLCGLAENRRCQALFDCMAEAVKCMAAVTALFFELLTVGVGLLMMTGGG